MNNYRKKYSASIIGLGNAGYMLDKDKARNNIWTHSKAYSIHKNINFVAVSDIKKNNYKLFIQDHVNIPFYKNYLEMIESVESDIISICTPTNTHLEIIRNIIKLKLPKAIFIEKPMGSNLKEAQEIVNLCRNANIKLAVNYMRRWDATYNLIREYLNNKNLGEVQFISGYGCTALLMSSSHLIDLILEFGGSIDWIIGELQSDYTRYVNDKADPGGIAFIKFNEGYHGILKSTSQDPFHYMFEVEILFTKGKISIADDGRKINVYKFTNEPSNTGSGYSGYKVLVKDNNNSRIKNNERMLDAISDIIYCIDKEQDPKSNGNNAILVHRLIEALHQSSQNSNKKILIKEL